VINTVGQRKHTMTKVDEKELHRLSDVLRALHEKVGDDVLASEALKKAALALSLGFVHGLRSEIEEHFAKLDLPLSAEEKAAVVKLGIPPDEAKKA
jgi:hypothetical protein